MKICTKHQTFEAIE